MIILTGLQSRAGPPTRALARQRPRSNGTTRRGGGKGPVRISVGTPRASPWESVPSDDSNKDDANDDRRRKREAKTQTTQERTDKDDSTATWCDSCEQQDPPTEQLVERSPRGMRQAATAAPANEVDHYVRRWCNKREPTLELLRCGDKELIRT